MLAPVYGEDKVKSGEPFTATLKGDVWTVVGHLNAQAVGGVALVEISKTDGKILRMTRGK